MTERLSLAGLRREMSKTVFVNFLWLEKTDCIWETRSFMISSVTQNPLTYFCGFGIIIQKFSQGSIPRAFVLHYCIIFLLS